MNRDNGAKILLGRIKQRLPELKTLLNEIQGHWVYEDIIYRFYHQSFKVYPLSSYTKKIVEMLNNLMPEISLNPWFMQIVNEGTSKEFNDESNNNWLKETRPIIEALIHAKYFLEMIVKYGEELKEVPNELPSGWASVLYLYNLR